MLRVALKNANFLVATTYSLCLKLVALQSSEPTSYHDELVKLQLETQQDQDCSLVTCLSKYPGARPPVPLASLMKDTKRLVEVGGDSYYLKRRVNASLLWAKSMVHEALIPNDRAAEASSSISAAADGQGVLREDLAIYGFRIPNHIKDYIKSNIQIEIPKPINPYRPTKLLSSDSTVGGRETQGSHKRT